MQRSQIHTFAAGTSGWLFIAMATLGLVPLYPEMARDLGLQADTFGFVIGFSALSSACLQVPMGLLADRFGLRLFMVAGLIASTTGSGLRAVAGVPPVFAVAQIAHGLATVCFQTGSITAMIQAFPGRGQGAAVGALWTAAFVGQAAAVLAIGFVGTEIGWRAASIGLAVLPLLALPLSVTLPPLPGALRVRPSGVRGETWRFFRQPPVLRIAAMAACANAATQTILFLSPFIMRQRALDAFATSLLLIPFLVGSMIGTPLIGMLSDRFGPSRPLVTAYVVTVFLLVVWAIGEPPSWVLAATYVGIGVSANSTYALGQRLTARAASEAGIGLGAALGGIRFAQTLSPVFAPVLAGTLFLRYGASTSVAVAAGLMLACAVMLLWNAWTPGGEPARARTHTAR